MYTKAEFVSWISAGAFALSHAVVVMAYSPSDIIATYAGNSTSGYSGDGGPAASAEFIQPTDMAFDAAGNLYVADDGGNTVRKVTTGGIITTFAGTSIAGFGGDGSAATAAMLNNPQGLAFDSVGNLYIADAGNNRIRKVTPGGIITTFAGTGASGCSNGTGDPLSATLTNPTGITFDPSGNLFISDTGNSQLREIANGAISTFFAPLGTACGNGTGGLRGLSSDARGNIYIAASAINIVYELDVTTGVGTVFAGTPELTGGYSGDGGAATAATLNAPQAVTFDNTSGSLYIADANNHCVRQVTPDNIIHTVAGDGTAGNTGDGGISTSAELGTIYGVALNAEHVLFVADSTNAVVREVGPAAPLSVTIAGDGIAATNDTVASADGRITCPGTCGQNYVSGMPVILLPGPASPDVLFQWSGGTCSGNGNCTAMPATLAPTSVTANFTPRYINTLFGGTVGPALNGPFGLAFANNGDLYFTETTDCLVRKRHDGVVTTVAGNGICGNLGDGIPALEAELNNPQGVAVDSSGNVYIQDTGNGLVRKVTPDGTLHTFASGLYAGSNSPGIAIDAANDLFVIATSTTIIRLTPDGFSHPFATVPGSYASPLVGLANGIQGGLVAYGVYYSGTAFVDISAQGTSYRSFYINGGGGHPSGMAYNARGSLYFDIACFLAANDYSANNAIQSRITTPGCGYSGDGGPASSATMNSPIGVVTDSAGYIYVADTGNNAVRVIYPDAIFTSGFEQ